VGIICLLLQVYFIALLGRVILSWFPMRSGGAGAQIFSLLHSVTEPVLAPVRRALPPMAGFDLSPIIVFFGLQIVAGLVFGCRLGL
jgi:YggT family protein